MQQVENTIVSRAQHEVVCCRHRSRVYPRSALNLRKSGKPDLRGPFRPVAVPDQRVHRSANASRCTASGTHSTTWLHSCRTQEQ
jgi:hypothetical protein